MRREETVSEWRHAMCTSAGFLSQGFRKSAKQRGIWELGCKGGRIELSQQKQGEVLLLCPFI